MSANDHEMIVRCILVVVGLTCLGSPVRAEERHELSEKAAAQLHRDKVVITGTRYRQVFTPYIFHDNQPLFITSDSVLNAWHVLLEKSVRKLEERFSSELPGALEKALGRLGKRTSAGADVGAYKAGIRRARLIMGVGLKLASGQRGDEGDLSEVIDAEVKRVEEAAGVQMPEWLAAEHPDIAGIDYAVFKPTGFYTGTERMQRYFRAIKWLQTAPWDLKQDSNAVAFTLIGEAFERDLTLSGISAAFKALIGKGTAVDIEALSDLGSLPNAGEPGELRKMIESRGDGSMPLVTVLSAACLPDLELFKQTTGQGRPFPDSLEVAAMLGSSLGQDAWRGNPKVLNLAIKGDIALKDGNGSGYVDYLNCLRDLLTEPEAGAPAFMKTPA